MQKYLFYRYNDILKQNNFEVKKVKHSIMTDDYVAIEEIQSQNCQYFVESVLDACRANNVSEKVSINNLPADEMMEINKDLKRENYWANFQTVDLLDCWSDFFFVKGRFPDSQDLIMVPQAEIPKFVRTQTALSPIDLYQKFKATDAKALVSIQALAALNMHLGVNSIVSKNALTEFLHNISSFK